MTTPPNYSREIIMELVHRFAGDDHLEAFSEALDALERSSADHWRSEFEACHDELFKAEAERDEARAEVERLKAGIKASNSHFEEYERKFYLEQQRSEELEAFIVYNCDPFSMTKPDAETFYAIHRKHYPQNY